MGCFWGAERVFWQADGVYSTAVGYAGGYTPNPTYEEACSGKTGHTEAVLVVFDPAKISYEEILALLGGPRPDAGRCARATTSAPSTARPSTREPEQAAAVEATKAAFGERLKAEGLRRDHHRDRAARELLLRRGLPPAVPREGP